MRIFTISELKAHHEAEKKRPFRDRLNEKEQTALAYQNRLHGPFRAEVDRATMTIDITNANGDVIYWIPLDRCRTPAQVLDWIFQVSKKTWCSNRLSAELVACFEEASSQILDTNAQGAWCPGGKPRAVNWPKPQQ